jgi:hypothetical protein
MKQQSRLKAVFLLVSVGLPCTGISPALANCKEFISAQRYNIRSIELENNRVQNWPLVIEDISNSSNGCKSFNGNYAAAGPDGPWGVSGTVCASSLSMTMRRPSTGEGDLHWISASCGRISMTGTASYTDANGAYHSYEWTMRPN